VLLEAGYYKGRILDYGIKKTSKGDPAPTIAFEVKDSAGATHKVYWQGSWNGKAMDFAMEALLVCGLKSSQNLMFLADGKASKALDLSLSFDLDIGVETNQSDPSKKYNRVNWINADGSSKIKDAITVQEFAPLLNQRNLVAELMRVAQEKGFDLSNSVLNKAPEVELPF
jgi:hypothetical protein